MPCSSAVPLLQGGGSACATRMEPITEPGAILAGGRLCALDRPLSEHARTRAQHALRKRRRAMTQPNKDYWTSSEVTGYER